MQVLIDGKGLQARQHLIDGQRLCTIITSLRKWHDAGFTNGDTKLSPDRLGRCHVLIVPTWPARQQQYSAREGETIQDFVRRGGGLLLMSNHEPFHKNDAQLARLFDIEFQPTYFRNRLHNVPTVLAGEMLNAAHPIISGASEQQRVRTVVTNTCSSIRCANGSPVIFVSREMVHRTTEQQPQQDQLFAHALDLNVHADSNGTGRVVTVADSGFIGSPWTEVPRAGLVTWGDNLQFVQNAVLWAGSEL